MSEIQYITPSTLDRDMKRCGLAIREFSLELNKPVLVKFSKVVNKKTLPQNSYFHLLAGLACKESGDNIADFKFRLKIKLGYYTKLWVNGKEEKLTKSLSKASLDDLIIFIDAVMGVCDFLNVSYMTPEQYYKSIGHKP